MLSSTYHTLSAIMVSRRPSSLTNGLSLLHDFGNNYMTVWAPISSTVQPIIPRRMGKLNESIKSSRGYGPTRDKHLPLAEFSYNNSYQESIKMSLFEALYGRPCRTPLSWSETSEQVIFGPDIVTEAEEKVRQIHANILTA
jgi:hypothetical protein